MLMKIFAAAVALAMCVTCLTACGNSDSTSDSTSGSSPDSSSSAPADTSSTDSSDETTPPVSSEPIDIKEGATEAMLERSVLSKGDTSRLASKIKYALDNPKELTTITFLGDSITAGSSASQGLNQYTQQFKTWWEENVSVYVTVNNAGIGATDSYLGVHRVQRDVLDVNPDIIFIEFINDLDDDFYKSTMDSLIRKCLSAENDPAVILIEMTMEDGTCPQNVHSEIAEAYGVPVISYHDAVLPEVQAGNIIWSDISPDNIHPNDDGHVLLGQIVSHFVGLVKDNLENESTEIEEFTAESPTGDRYANATLANRDSEEINVTDEGNFTEAVNFQTYFTNGWGTATGGSMTFEVEAKNIGLVYNKAVSKKYGIAKITVDGEEVAQIDADFTGGWGSYACSQEVYRSEETAKHTVTIEIVNGDEKPYFQIYSLLIS